MVSREDCLMKAEDCERLAGELSTYATQEAYRAEAKKWRALAEMPDEARAGVETPDEVFRPGPE